MNRKGNRFSLFSRLVLLMGSVVILSILLTESYFNRHERTMLEMRLREKATFINNFYAFLIADALAHDDDITLFQVINRLEQDPEITGVEVIDEKGMVRYNADAEKIGAEVHDPLLQKALETGEGFAHDFNNSGGRALALICPLKVKGGTKSLGAVSIEFTYKHIREQTRSGMASFEMMAMGALSMCVGATLWGIRKWIMTPLFRLKTALNAVNPATLDAALPEADDEFGQINAALNEFFAKVKTEWSNQRAAILAQNSDERVLIEQLLRGLMPDARALIIDKENRVVCDTGRENTLDMSGAPHLLEAVTDAGFIALLGEAVQKEGGVTRGAVRFQDQPYEASILRLLDGQSKVVKMIVALKPNLESQSKKEAV